MFEGISEYENIQRKNREPGDHLIKRKRLIGMLLARRSSLRVICAPAQFGKSVLAYQYAREAFQDGEVCWIDASEPSFLIALDTLSDQENHAEDHHVDSHKRKRPQLIVVDDCPSLDPSRYSCLCSLINARLALGDEVLLTTRDTRWIALRDPYPEVIDAQLLMLTRQELTQWDQAIHELTDHSYGTSEMQSPLQLIAGYRHQPAKAGELFFESLVSQEIASTAQALTIIMLVLDSGALHELSHYVQSFDRALMNELEHSYPYVGITALSPLFSCAPLTEQQRFALIRHHLGAICAALPLFNSEEQLLDQLLADLLKRKRLDLATRLVCGFPESEKRIRFFDEYAIDFLYSGKPLALLYLTRTLPQESFSLARRLHAVVYALALVGEKDHAKRLLFSYEQALSKSEYCARATNMTKDEERYPSEFGEALVQIMVGGNECFTKQVLGSLLSACIKYQQKESFQQADRPRFEDDLVRMLAYTLEDPLKGYERLNEIMASGYSMKETLFALCVFSRMLIFMWHDRSVGDAMKHSVPVSIHERVEPDEQELLEEFGQQVARILTRATEVLAPNSIELVLFAALHQLLGERVYLFTSDSILSRIQLLRDDLDQQRKKGKRIGTQDQLLAMPSDRSSEQLMPAGKKALRINTFGRFEIEANDPSIIIKGKVRKQLRLLIALLAINEGRELARPWVQRTMWPDAPDRNAKQSLYSMWSLLNKSVIDQEGNCPFFESYPQSIALNSALVETDTQLLDSICRRLRYETLDIPLYEKAIEELEDLYRGPLLPGEDIAEVVASRKKYHDRLIEALVRGGEQLRKSGATALALRYFRFAFENEPTREDVCYLLMLTLWKLGRHGEALNEYFVCRRALIDRFGIEGTTKLRKLYDAILADAS